MSKTIKGLTIEIDGSTQGLQKALGEVNKQSRDITKELKEVDKLLKFNPNDVELLTQKKKLLGDQIGATKEKLDTLKQAQAQVTEEFEKGNISEAQYRDFQREIVETESKLKHYQNQLKEVDNVHTGLSAKLDELGGKFQDVGKKMEGVGKNLSMKVTAPIMAIGAAAVKAGSDFEAGMSEVKAISGASAEDFEALKDKAKEMGASTKFSATESAEALKYMAMAGWDAEKMVGGLEGVMNLAAASGENLGTVSDIVTDAITAFGLKAEDAGHFADVLATASSSANTNVSLMGETFKYAAPVAGALGYSIEDTALAIGLMANAGIKGSMAGTALRSILTEMTGDIAVTGDSFGQFDVQTQNADGTMRDFADVLEELRGIWPMLTEAERAHNAEQIAGKNAMSGFLALMGGSDEDFKKLQDNIDNSTGKAKEMADTMNDNLQGQLVLLKSQLEGVAIQISEVLIPVFSKIIEKISEWVSWFGNLDEGTRKTIIMVAGLIAAIGPMLLIIGKTITILGTTMKAFGLVGAAIAGITAPIAIAIAAVGLIIAIGISLYKNWDTVKEKAGELWRFLQTKFEEIRTAITDPINKAIETLKNINLFDIGKNIISGLINGIKSMVGNVASAIGGIASTVTGGVKSALGIKSPSKVMMGLGEDTGEGFAVGLANSMKSVSDQTKKLSSAPTGINAGGGGQSNSVNHSGVITVKGVNSQDALVGVVDIVMDQLRKEVRMA